MGPDDTTPKTEERVSKPIVIDGGARKHTLTGAMRKIEEIDRRIESEDSEIIKARISFRETLVENFFKPSVYLPTIAAVVLVVAIIAGVLTGTFDFVFFGEKAGEVAETTLPGR